MLEDYGAAIARSEVYVHDGGTAMIALEPRPDHLLVRDVAVDPAAQGKGLGTRLMRFAELRAAELGLAELRLFTNEAMTESIRFYERLGYRELERLQQDGYRRVLYGRSLGAGTGRSG
jgi:ribosomal protein S18 acetylase RimI-like enzyme